MVRAHWRDNSHLIVINKVGGPREELLQRSGPLYYGRGNALTEISHPRSLPQQRNRACCDVRCQTCIASPFVDDESYVERRAT